MNLDLSKPGNSEIQLDVFELADNEGLIKWVINNNLNLLYTTAPFMII